jgi:hypothetical protein
MSHHSSSSYNSGRSYQVQPEFRDNNHGVKEPHSHPGLPLHSPSQYRPGAPPGSDPRASSDFNMSPAAIHSGPTNAEQLPVLVPVRSGSWSPIVLQLQLLVTVLDTHRPPITALVSEISRNFPRPPAKLQATVPDIAAIIQVRAGTHLKSLACMCTTAKEVTQHTKIPHLKSRVCMPTTAKEVSQDMDTPSSDGSSYSMYGHDG